VSCWAAPIALLGRPRQRGLVSGEPAGVGEAFRLDLPRAGDAAFVGRGHGHQATLSEGALHLREPLGGGGAGTVDHEDLDQEFFSP
jgi:hypothetical protein